MTTKEFNHILRNLTEQTNFEKFYEEYYPFLIKVSKSVFRNAYFCNDVAQDVCRYLLTHTDAPFVRNPNAWLYTLCKNAGLKYLNKDVPLIENAPYASFTEKYDCGELDAMLQCLTDEEKEIVELKHLIGFSLKEIAQIKGKTYMAVLKQHNRILNKLRKKLSQKS